MSTSKFSDSEHGEVSFERDGSIAILTLNRPKVHNSLSWTMYEQLEQHLVDIASDSSIRALVLRGAGEKAFAAGTDIKQFVNFTGEDGLRYEERIDRVVNRLATLPIPTIAAINGYAVGGGLMLSVACDLRYATPTARFGAPMARTLGNCLSQTNYQRLAQAFGVMRTKELLFTARLISADEAITGDFLTSIVDGNDWFAKVLEIANQIANNAPLTLWATKQALPNLGVLPDESLNFHDVVAKVYGSSDFAEGVRAHIEKRSPQWQGK